MIPSKKPGHTSTLVLCVSPSAFQHAVALRVCWKEFKWVLPRVEAASHFRTEALERGGCSCSSVDGHLDVPPPAIGQPGLPGFRPPHHLVLLQPPHGKVTRLGEEHLVLLGRYCFLAGVLSSQRQEGDGSAKVCAVKNGFLVSRVGCYPLKVYKKTVKIRQIYF